MLHCLFPSYLQGRETGCLQHSLTFVHGEDKDDAWAFSGWMHFQAGERPVGLHAVLCFLVDMNLLHPSLPDVFLSAYTSCLSGSCFKEHAKKYIYICWGLPTGHFLNSSYTSVERKQNPYLLHFCMCMHLSRQLSLFFLSPPLRHIPLLLLT